MRQPTIILLIYRQNVSIRKEVLVSISRKAERGFHGIMLSRKAVRVSV